MQQAPATPASALIALALMACQSAADSPDPLEPACAHICASVACDGLTDVEEDSAQPCTKTCVDSHATAENISTHCADAYARLITCINDSSCEELLDWGYNLDESQTCTMQSEELAETCPGFELSFDAP